MTFIVLPDHPAAAGLRKRLPADESAVLAEHDSGRPWLVGRRELPDVTAASVGANRLVLIGAAGVTVDRLTVLLRAVRSVSDLDSLLPRVPGCYHAVASIGGQVRFQGTLSTACHVFYAKTGGVTVGADRPQALVALTGASLDEELLALQLLAPYGPPWPLSDRPVWRGVQSPPSGHYLRLDSQATAHLVRWWSPPEPHVPLAVAAPRLQEALIAAVDARFSRDRLVSADLSGGMDSTSLCYLATRRGDSISTIHYESVDPANADLDWATRCQADLPRSRHVVVPPQAQPGPYAELVGEDPEPDLEGPLSLIRRVTVEHSAQLASSLGARRHLLGIGSDELFRPGLMCLHGAVRQQPLRSLRQTRAVRSMRRLGWGAMLRALGGIGSYPRWLAQVGTELTAERRWVAETGWEVVPKMPPWATPAAVDTARRLLSKSAAEDPSPLARLPVQHQMIRLTQVNGTTIRRGSRVGARFGVTFHAPFLDDQILQSALSIRLADRMAVGWAKPVLAAALRGAVPEALLARRNKGDRSPELYVSLRRYRAELDSLCGDSILVRMGLVDEAALRAVVFGMHPDARPMMSFDPTLMCELWLRTAMARPGLAV